MVSDICLYIDLYRPRTRRAVLVYPNKLQHVDILYSTNTKLVKLIPNLLLIK